MTIIYLAISYKPFMLVTAMCIAIVCIAMVHTAILYMATKYICAIAVRYTAMIHVHRNSIPSYHLGVI